MRHSTWGFKNVKLLHKNKKEVKKNKKLKWCHTKFNFRSEGIKKNIKIKNKVKWSTKYGQVKND